MNNPANQHDLEPNGRNAPERSPVWMALAIAVALVGIYHEPADVGEDDADFLRAADSVAQQDATDNQVQVGNLQEKVSFAVLLMIGAYLVFVAQPERRWRPNRLAWLVVGCFSWAVLSLLWSAEPAITLRELIRLCGVALVAFGIARHYTVNQAMFIALVICAVSIFVAVVSEVAAGCLKPWTQGYRLRGGMHANMVALHATIVAISSVAFLRISKRKALFGLFIAVAFTVLLLTKSRTGVATFLVGVVFLWSLRFDPRRTAAFWSSLVAVSAVVMLALAIGGSQWQSAFGGAAVMGRHEDVGSLTGRIPLWQLLAHYIQERPLLGFGYEAFWTGERRLEIEQELVWYPPDAHSIYVNTMLELGLIGTLLNLTLAIAALVLLVRAYRETDRMGYAFFATLICVALFHGLAEIGCSTPRIAGLCIGAGVFLAAGWRTTVDQPARKAAHEKRAPRSTKMMMGGSL